MSSDPHQKLFSSLREQINRDEYHLYRSVVQACPDPDKHRAVQHRDGKPPWCPLCGRTNRGVKVKEVGVQ